MKCVLEPGYGHVPPRRRNGWAAVAVRPAPLRSACTGFFTFCVGALVGTAGPIAPTSVPSPITPFATLTAEGWNNVAGGLKTGAWWNTLLDFGIEADLAGLGGPADSHVVVQLHWTHNRDDDTCFTDYTGASNPVSGTMTGDHLRFFNLHYHQSWADGSRALKIGQIAIDDDFMGSDYSGLFMNSAFGAMPSQVGTTLSSRCGYTSAFPIYAVAAPGVFFRMQTDGAFSWQAGLYHGGPGPDDEDNHGFDWEGSSRSGVVTFVEGARAYSLAGRAGTFRLGGSVHTGCFEDYAALNDGETDPFVRGLFSVYAINDLVLLANAEKNPVLAAFSRVGVSPRQDRCVVTLYADSGLNWFAPFSSRPDDIAGVAVAWSKFGDEFRRFAGTASSETALEFTYRARLTSAWSLQGDVQFLLDPAPDASGDRKNATVLGLRTELAF